MTQFEKSNQAYSDTATYESPEPANQSAQPSIAPLSSYDTFVKYYAKFMMVVGILGQFLFYVQAQKIYTTGSASGVSLEGFLISCFSLSCWLVYGLLVKDRVLFWVNVVGVVGAALVVVAILKFS